MFNSIQHFNEISVVVLDKVLENFYKDPTNIAGFVKGISEELMKVGTMMIRETLENMDRLLCDSGRRKMEWVVERHDTKTLLTTLGEVTFRKTLFENRETKEQRYLLDEILGIEKNARMTEDAEAAMLEEAVQTSYRRGGEAASLMYGVSKQTVMTKIHSLQFMPAEKPEKKKKVDYLYIEADEDHVPLQFISRKGDIKTDENGRKKNNAITKMIYVHEGIEPEAPKSRRFRLINPHYFSAVASGKANEALWKEVSEYIESHYERKNIKKIYINSDGGSWIKSGFRIIQGVTHVLDGYHLDKSLSTLTNHMLDSADDVKDEIRRIIKSGTKAEFSDYTDTISEYFKEENVPDSFTKARNYIINNWTAARYRLIKKEGITGSSTEGHVYHLLSSRMSTQAMGWSLLGADKMARLRAYYKNGGDLLELVRYQKKILPEVAGAEDVIFSASEIISQERHMRHDQLGKYYDAIKHSICVQDKKKLYFQSHIWGL